MEDRCRRLFEYLKKQLGDELEFYDYRSTDDLCIIDFTSKSAKDTVDCELLCDLVQAEDYDECVETCRKEVESFASGSIAVDLKEFTVKEANLPVPCYKVQGTTWEETERKIKQMAHKLKNVGCEEIKDVKEFIHSHEFVRDYLGAFEPEEEMPAICYIHTKGCSPVDLLKAVYGSRKKA